MKTFEKEQKSENKLSNLNTGNSETSPQQVITYNNEILTLQKIRGNRVVQELFRNIDTIQCKDHEKSVSMDIQYCPIEYTLQYAITLTEKDLIEQIHLYQQKLSKDDTDSPVYPVYLNNLIVLEEAAMQKIKNKEHQSQIFSKDEKVIPGSTATLSTSHEVSASDVVKFARDNYSNLPYGKFADAKKTIPLDIQKDVIDKIPKQARDQHIEEAIKRGNMVCNVLVEAVMRGSGFSDFPLTDHSYAGPGKPEHDWRIDIGLDWGLRHAHYIASTGGTVYFNSIFPADLNKEQRDTVVNQTAKFKTTSGIPAEAQEGDIVIFLRSIEPVKDKGVDIIYRSYYHEAIVTKSGNKFVLFAARSTGNPSGNQYGEFTSYDDLSASDQKMLLYILRPNYKPVPQTQNINRFQTKLTIGEPTDAYELEANHVAEIVMNMSDPVEVLSLVEKKRDGVRLKSTGTYTAITDVFEMEIDALRGTGQPLPDSERQFFEPRFGLDFSNVRIHDGTRADEIARKINAQAFTLNNEIVFSQNKYKPNTENGRRLLAHELSHVVQQGNSIISTRKYELMQRLPEKDSVQEGEWKIFIIGSPSPGEISANHPYQFVNAAICQKVDKNTVWIVERTGYEAGNIDLNFIESSIGEGKLIWITPENSLVAILNTFPANSINSMYVYSHGLVGRITLRYGWEHTGRQNYGLNIPEVLKMKKDIFTGNALISFDSCNSGSSDFEYPYGNIAQQFAQQSGNDVKAWTGRTSYREVNNPSGTCNVEASQIFRGWNKPDFKEMGSRYLFNRVPEQRTYSPIRGIRVGGFQSYFEIKVRLPSTRNFDVPENGSVLVTCPNPDLIIPEEMEEFFRRDYSYTIYGASQETEKSYSRRVTPMLGQFWIALYKSGDVSIGMHVFPVHANSEQAIWSNLSGGSYYLEIYRFAGNTGLPIRSDINVEIYK